MSLEMLNTSKVFSISRVNPIVKLLFKFTKDNVNYLDDKRLILPRHKTIKEKILNYNEIMQHNQTYAISTM